MPTPHTYSCECKAKADILVLEHTDDGTSRAGFSACYAHAERAVRYVHDATGNKRLKVLVVTDRD